MEFNLETLRRMLKDAGAKRVSDAAAVEFGNIITQRAQRLLHDAGVLAYHSKRSTVLRSDVKHSKKGKAS